MVGGRVAQAPEGLRARKQRETRQRIVEAGLRLFLKQGFDATTLDAIAEAADISRRTFFHYFESKEAIVQALENDAEAAFRDGLADVPDKVRPLEAVQRALHTMLSAYQSEEALAIDRVMRSTEALRARKQANYGRREEALYTALREKWPAPERALELRVIAMMGIGAMRLAAEQWSEEQGRLPLRTYLDDAFRHLAQ
jgi:AcrR family transcriptional regulator